MRKLLLASAAIVVLGVPTAMAAGSHGVQVTATVTETCGLTAPNDVTFGEDPEVGASDTSTFDLECNFAGEGGNPIPLTVSFESANGGLSNPGDTEARDYTIAYQSGTPFTASSTQGTPEDIGDSVTAANTAEARTFVVTLADALPVAGAYSDTLTVSVVP